MKLPTFSSLAQDQMNRLLSLYKNYSDNEPYANGLQTLLVKDSQCGGSLFNFSDYQGPNFAQLPVNLMHYNKL